MTGAVARAPSPQTVSQFHALPPFRLLTDFIEQASENAAGNRVFPLRCDRVAALPEFSLAFYFDGSTVPW
jgi:hypothetical protein